MGYETWVRRSWKDGCERGYKKQKRLDGITEVEWLRSDNGYFTLKRKIVSILHPIKEIPSVMFYHQFWFLIPRSRGGESECTRNQTLWWTGEVRSQRTVSRPLVSYQGWSVITILLKYVFFTKFVSDCVFITRIQSQIVTVKKVIVPNYLVESWYLIGCYDLCITKYIFNIKSVYENSERDVFKLNSPKEIVRIKYYMFSYRILI